MCKMYGIIEDLCAERGIKPGKLCADLSISRGIMSDLKAGRTKRLSAENIGKIAAYFGVSSDYLLGFESKEKASTRKGERSVSDDDIKFALFGGDCEITDAMYDEVRNFAAYVKQREANKKKE